VFTTPNGIYGSYNNLKTLSGSEGLFEFEGNDSLSSLWRLAYGSSVPNPFVLEFVNWDFDGIQNVAYLGNITVASTPLG
jgi:hypothetical protein